MPFATQRVGVCAKPARFRNRRAATIIARP
ncbi:hypothetical protein BDSB_20590 [Burkholderia dolosa PC543]|nr:hypothetical protein BDSB_20590 [Burkholderia dolosa PC543]